jgi:rhodanese-related sulfurtransferase
VVAQKCCEQFAWRNGARGDTSEQAQCGLVAGGGECDHRLPGISSYERRVVILCQQGYASSFAAASLRALGYQHVGDVIGGFDAWRAAGLPVQAGA